jgi:phosphoribosylaminoimidazolecarboxamide formyltransferase/IMP cyclohydrolase
MPRRALISVSDKSGLGPFARGLVELGFEIVSTGGTSRFLREQDVPVIDISEYTGFPEIMDGRVKTLHPKVHGAILGRPDLPGDAAAIAAHGIIPFELVVVNLYPFEQTVASAAVTHEEAVEQIDIGGPSMVRSAAKNHAYVSIVTRPDQYSKVLSALQNGSVPIALRRQLMQAAFEMTSRYDAAIASHFSATARTSPEMDAIDDSPFPADLSLVFQRRQVLRYGENPHQAGAWYVEKSYAPDSLSAAEQIHGKELSYNNLLDLDAAMSIVGEFQESAAVVVKHNNPCGCAIGATLAEAFDKAYEGDPVSAFGSILGFNRTVDLATAEAMCAPNRFIEAIIAPGFDADALEALTTRPKWKGSVRLLKLPKFGSSRSASLEYRRVSGGLLVQDRDDRPDPSSEWKVATKRAPNEHELRDLEFAWKVCKHVKSNAIVFAKAGMLLGAGAGQMSRVDSSRIAADKAGDRGRGAVVASDAFFPFRDGVDHAAKAGVTALIQPGGSVRDEEVIAACDEQGLAMILTGRRHFRH